MARLLAIDPGTKRCGVAISDSNETLAFPREAIMVDDRIAAAIVALSDEEGAAMIVVGRPLSLGGAETASTALADDLVQRLLSLTTLPVVQWDERFTTTQAQRQMRDAGVNAKDGRSRIDSAAAVVLLQDFMEARRAS